MLRLFLPFIALLLALPGLAQRHEFGAMVGSATYSGELSRRVDLTESNLGLHGVYRYNLSNPVSWRTNVGLSLLRASDEPAFDPLTEQRRGSMSATVLDINTGLEYHFLDYRPRESWIRVSPYLYGGVGVAYMITDAELLPVVPIVPLAVGVKYKALVDLDLGIEFSARKTFTDRIDGLEDSATVPTKNYNFGNSSTSDWYYFLGFTLSYRIYSTSCPQDFDKPYFQKGLTP